MMPRRRRGTGPARMASVVVVVVAIGLAACTPAAPGAAPLTAPETTASATATGAVGARMPADAPLTRAPAVPFVPPRPYPATPPGSAQGWFWYGSSELWTGLPGDATWRDLPYNAATGYGQKTLWSREGYDPAAEPRPALTVTGVRLDAQAPPVVASPATNATTESGSGMLVGIELPTPGVWRITGSYRGHELSYVVWVAP